MKTIGLFADVGNLYYCVKKRYANRKLDYHKYLTAVSGDSAVYRAYAYGVQVSNEAIKFITCLKHLGYDPKYKQPKVFEKEGKVTIKRISWNVGIAMDVVRIVDKLDTVILGTSDANLVPLVDWVKERGVRCEVFACGISKELRDSVDKWTEIEEDLLEDENVDFSDSTTTD